MVHPAVLVHTDHTQFSAVALGLAHLWTKQTYANAGFAHKYSFAWTLPTWGFVALWVLTSCTLAYLFTFS